jgi:hypothetical protein
VTPQARGASAADFLAGLERHEPYPDWGTLSHVIVVEARKGRKQPEDLARLRREIWETFWMHVEVSDRGPIGHDGVAVPRTAAAGTAVPRSRLGRFLRGARQRLREIAG